MNPRYHFAGLTRWLRLIIRHGRPDALFYFNGGIGDQLLCTAVARECQLRGRSRIWFLTHVPELFAANHDFRAVLPFDLALIPWARLNGTHVKQLFYQDHIASEGRDASLYEPSIAALCRRAGITGEVTLRPYLPQITTTPVTRRSRPRIVIQSSCLAARYPIVNKQWPAENMQAVATQLSEWAELRQLGATQDPLLPGTKDLRGCSLISAARELSECDLFVGLVGFLMHLARAVECPAVIVYGGREPSIITGYSCNINLSNQPPCSPCWYYSRCDFERRCLSAITPSMVVQAVKRQLESVAARPLPADRFMIRPA